MAPSPESQSSDSLASDSPAASWLVALALPIAPYTFAPPHGFTGPPPVGSRVLVPWQKGVAVGIVVGGSEHPTHQLREAIALLDAGSAPWISPAFIAAAQQLCGLSRLPLGLLLSDMVGVGWDSALSHRVKLVAGADVSAFQGLPAPSPLLAQSPLLSGDWALADNFTPATLDLIREQGLLHEEVAPQPAQVPLYRPLEEGTQPLTPRQQHAWEVLRGAGQFVSQVAWAQQAGVSASVVTGVLARGWAELVLVDAPPPALPLPESPLPVSPLAAQPDTLPEELVWRLHGGRAAQRYALLAARIERLLSIGRSVVVMAPDAATLREAWAALSGAASRAGTQAVQVSGLLSTPQREHTWSLIRSGAARLVIGTYLGLCAPLSDLALVVVLEEGSDAYKLPAGSAAFVPDIARRMAQHLQTPLAYVGTVPAVESVALPGQIVPPPRSRLHIVDYARLPQQPKLGPLSGVQFRPDSQGYPLSHDLAKVLRQVAERGRQAVLLAPRRGYSALIRCPECEYVPQCQNCDIPLRLHQQSRRLSCHQCGYSRTIPERCDVCGHLMWQARGPGTEWIGAEVSKLLPGFGVYHFDKDRQDELAPLYEGEAGVIVATQAILARPAPPALALVGITLADTWLSTSDFRASERYHRLLRQLAAWHPQHAPLLVVQTFQAQHPALLSLEQGEDVAAFVRSEYELRRALHYPPHAQLAQITVAARDQARASKAADEVAAALFNAGATATEVLGPAASPVARLKGLYPYHLFLRPRDEQRLDSLLQALQQSFSARVRVDISPRGSLGL